MKKFLAILLILITLPVVAEVVESVLNVEATVNKEVAPDTATVRFFVENSGTNLAEIKKKNDETVNKAVTEIKKKLNENETVKTIAFSVNDVYTYKDKVRIFQKYEVKNGFEVKIKDLEKVSTIINIAMQNGVRKIDRLNFNIENGEALCNQMMAQALETAKNRAVHLAQTANLTLDRPKNINPYCSLTNNYIQPKFYANTTMRALSDAAAGEAEFVEAIEPGVISVRAGVNMSYYLK